MYNGKVVVYTSGTFDVFHSNHLKMIKYARGLGDTLIIGVSTDELVCSYKKPPIIPFEERLSIVEALKYPDIIIPQRTLDHTEIVKKLNIDVFVVGDDWVGKYADNSNCCKRKKKHVKPYKTAYFPYFFVNNIY